MGMGIKNFQIKGWPFLGPNKENYDSIDIWKIKFRIVSIVKPGPQGTLITT